MIGMTRADQGRTPRRSHAALPQDIVPCHSAWIPPPWSPSLRSGKTGGRHRKRWTES